MNNDFGKCNKICSQYSTYGFISMSYVELCVMPTFQKSMYLDNPTLIKKKFSIDVTSLALGSRLKQRFTRLQAKRKLGNERKCEGMNPHTPKRASTLGVWSLDGLSNFHRMISGAKTHWIEKLIIALESY